MKSGKQWNITTSWKFTYMADINESKLDTLGQRLIRVLSLHTEQMAQKYVLGTSQVAQWLRIRLSIQGTRVQSLVWEDPTCCGATKPVRHNYWACSRARKPQLLSPRTTTTEAHAPRAHAPQQEKPLQWEACSPQWRVAPMHSNEDPTQTKINKFI